MGVKGCFRRGLKEKGGGGNERTAAAAPPPRLERRLLPLAQVVADDGLGQACVRGASEVESVPGTRGKGVLGGEYRF